jgi:hypothetical protein
MIVTCPGSIGYLKVVNLFIFGGNSEGIEKPIISGASQNNELPPNF